MTWKYWLWYLFAPSLWGLYAIAAAAVLAALGRPVRLLRWIAAALGYTLFIAFLGGWWLVMRPLEDAARDLARPPDGGPVGILVLGGGEDLVSSALAGDLVTNDAGERVIAGLELAALHPRAPVFFASGDLAAGAPAVRARIATLFHRVLGRKREIVVDGSSRDTCDNLAAVARHERRHGRRIWILVTSAYHMPRAVLCAQAAGVQVAPHPTDWRAAGGLLANLPSRNPVRAMEHFDAAAHEWVGLIYYRLAGRIRRIWPASHGR